MPLLNKLASFFGNKPEEGANALAKSPYIKWPGELPEHYGYGGNKFVYGQSLLTNNSPLEVQGYRYDRRKGKLETLPSKFNMESVRMSSTAIGDAIRNKIPGFSENITPEIVTAMLLKEGRTDLGANDFNINDPQSVAIYKRYEDDYGSETASIIASIYDKAKVAKRLKIPFAQAWIGTGKTRYETSRQYADDMENFKKIATDPKNRSLRNFIAGAMSAPISGEEHY